MKRTFQQLDPRSNPFHEPIPEPPWKKNRFPLDSAHLPLGTSELRQNAVPLANDLGRFCAQIGLPTATHEKKMKDVAHVLGIDD